MKQYTNAILWPANPNKKGEDVHPLDEMVPQEGNIEKHIEFIKDKKAVYWDIGRKCRELKGPFKGYIYITKPVKKVKYECKVDWVISRDKLKKMKKERQYIPPFRMQCLTKHFPEGKKHKPSPTWVKISKIKKLNTPIKLSKFKKEKDGRQVKKVRSFVRILPLNV